ncbi:MAG: S-methyl-5'-thioadenosine phosphorylase [Lentisphaerae bacterium ADurb.BinA184]|nr:MAG: S-methyl-5'-thioadenosine phosphorylase [Lentisphaerae bacterium ADurb.BinA184]
MKIGIIGGSGLYGFDDIRNPRDVTLDTPFGRPSDAYQCGEVEGVETVFLARHGRGHTLMPSEINFRANLYGMKALGVERIISVSAVGSLREEMAPRDVVLVDQFVDRTKRSADHTFFGRGIVAHVAFADPVCGELHDQVAEAAERVLEALPPGPAGRRPHLHRRGTYLNMEGPAFSTRAESYLHKSWGMDVIGMTNLAEAKLAREAEICYATMALVTDYDCWHAVHEDVTIDLVVKTLLANVEAARAIIRLALPRVARPGACACRDALRNAVITAPDRFPAKTRAELDLFLAKYFPAK